ncbi:hypothetical protein LTR65_010387 [Meristemomyces frigidus]
MKALDQLVRTLPDEQRVAVLDHLRRVFGADHLTRTGIVACLKAATEALGTIPCSPVQHSSRPLSGPNRAATTATRRSLAISFADGTLDIPSRLAMMKQITIEVRLFPAETPSTSPQQLLAVTDSYEHLLRESQEPSSLTADNHELRAAPPTSPQPPVLHGHLHRKSQELRTPLADNHELRAALTTSPQPPVLHGHLHCKSQELRTPLADNHELRAALTTSPQPPVLHGHLHCKSQELRTPLADNHELRAASPTSPQPPVLHGHLHRRSPEPNNNELRAAPSSSPLCPGTATARPDHLRSIPQGPHAPAVDHVGLHGLSPNAVLKVKPDIIADYTTISSSSSSSSATSSDDGARSTAHTRVELGAKADADIIDISSGCSSSSACSSSAVSSSRSRGKRKTLIDETMVYTPRKAARFGMSRFDYKPEQHHHSRHQRAQDADTGSETQLFAPPRDEDDSPQPVDLQSSLQFDSIPEPAYPAANSASPPPYQQGPSAHPFTHGAQSTTCVPPAQVSRPPALGGSPNYRKPINDQPTHRRAPFPLPPQAVPTYLSGYRPPGSGAWLGTRRRPSLLPHPQHRGAVTMRRNGDSGGRALIGKKHVPQKVNADALAAKHRDMVKSLPETCPGLSKIRSAKPIQEAKTVEPVPVKGKGLKMLTCSASMFKREMEAMKLR